ncbi:hypothetical protein DITRI_Ditri12bG0099000 [Diplodiscus trichospermus]
MSCSKRDIVISQAVFRAHPRGIPSYRVHISNEGNHPIRNLHFHCGSFGSANLINPKLFQRLKVDDCLVNNGKSLAVGTAIAFTYTNTFMYPLSLSKFTC